MLNCYRLVTHESKAMSVNISYCYMKIHHSVLTLNGFFNPCIGHLVKMESLSYANIPCIATFHYTISKNFICLYHHRSHGKIFIYFETVKLMVVDASFPKFQFSLEILNWIIGHKSRQLYSLMWQTYFILEKTSAKSRVWRVCL